MHTYTTNLSASSEDACDSGESSVCVESSSTFPPRFDVNSFTAKDSVNAWLFNHCIGGAAFVSYKDGELRFIEANELFFRETGLTRKAFADRSGTDFAALLSPESAASFSEMLAAAGRLGSASCEVRFTQSDCHVRVVCNAAAPFAGGSYFMLLFEDITEMVRLRREHEEMQLKEREQRWKNRKYQTLLEVPGCITYDYNPSRDRLTIDICTDTGEMVQKITEHFLTHNTDYEWLAPGSVVNCKKAFAASLKNIGTAYVDFRGRFYGSEYLWYRCVLTGVADSEGKIYRIVGRADNIDKDIRVRSELQSRAQQDSLTGLLNHEAFYTAAEEANRKNGGGTFVIMDIDDFKDINDSRGHLFGDEILKAVGDTLRRTFRQNDILSRIGGDEFAVFLPGIKNTVMAQKRAETLLKSLNCISIHDEKRLAASIGICVADTGKHSMKDVMQLADKALYSAKRKGKNRFVCA